MLEDRLSYYFLSRHISANTGAAKIRKLMRTIIRNRYRIVSRYRTIKMSLSIVGSKRKANG